MDNPFEFAYDLCNSTTEPLTLPYLLDIELTNTCNLSCDKCPTGMGTCKRPKGFMSGNVFHKILSEATAAIRFVRWGEPTLHPRLYDWISEAKGKGLLTHINTNGILLDVEEVLDCGLDSIKFSLHGRNVSEKVNSLYERTPRPYITVTNYEIMRDLSKPPQKYKPCPEVFCKLSIDWDGKVTACCGDYDRIMTIGDVKESSLKEIWNCDKMNYYRQMLTDFRHAELPLCRCCGI